MPDSKVLAVVMNNILTINPNKDSSFAMMLEAQSRGYQIVCFDTNQMSLNPQGVLANATMVKLTDTNHHFVRIIRQFVFVLTDADIILMRKDPPFNMNYIYATYLLEKVEEQGVMIINKPQSLRDFNEKLSITNFPECITNTLVTSNQNDIKDFLTKHQDIIIKPLDGMGGQNIFKLSLTKDDPIQINQHINNLTHQGITPIMAQKYLPEIALGDKRILIINGKPIDYALARIPKKGNFKGNLAAGATGVAQPLSARDYWLCEQIAPTLQASGLLLVGLDVIGDYITEINITSPTGIRELDKQCELNIASVLFDEVL